MTNLEMTRAYLKQARSILREARSYLDMGDYHLAVRRCQEVVELTLKGLLRGASVEVPHVHDVSFVLKQHVHALPAAIGPQLDLITSISRRLRGERELAFYGDDQVDAPAAALYAKSDATSSIDEATLVLELVQAQFEKQT